MNFIYYDSMQTRLTFIPERSGDFAKRQSNDALQPRSGKAKKQGSQEAEKPRSQETVKWRSGEFRSREIEKRRETREMFNRN